MIKLIITKTILNPDYEEEKKLWDSKSNYERDKDRPNREIQSEILKTEITEEQFSAIRGGCLKEFGVTKGLEAFKSNIVAQAPSILGQTLKAVI